MFNMNDYFKAYIGGMRHDKFLVSVWLWFKGKKYQERRRRVLIYQYKKKAIKNMRMAMSSGEGLMSYVKKDVYRGASYPRPKEVGDV